MTSLYNKLLCKAPKRVHVQRVREPEHQFLYSNLLICCNTLTNCGRATNQRCIAIERSYSVRQFRLGLFIRILNDTVRPRRAMDVLIVTSHCLAMLLEHRQLVFQGAWVAMYVPGIAILRDQLQRALLSIARNQHGNMGLLNSFRLVDG